MIVLKTILMISLIAVMVLLLMGINYFVVKQAPADPEDDTAVRMRRDVEKDDRVITALSVFNDFLARDRRDTSRRYKAQRDYDD